MRSVLFSRPGVLETRRRRKGGNRYRNELTAAGDGAVVGGRRRRLDRQRVAVIVHVTVEDVDRVGRVLGERERVVVGRGLLVRRHDGHGDVGAGGSMRPESRVCGAARGRPEASPELSRGR